MSPVEKHTVLQPQRQYTKKVRRQIHRGGITKGERLLYFMMVPVIAIAAVLIISNYSQIYSANAEIQTTEAAVTAQADQNEALTLQVKELSDPERILSIAKNELGMTLDNSQVKVLHQPGD
ncbi:cell division protein FtsL [Alkalicoccus urumqiensis]|uniref:Cell division protein FtsL n=1 Tax=Alkalicoccus urumqiensis TaxID=1548213 RepID=A0A2P6MGF8_ALKUR|nr:cell division protein FtsL [Alkalicoccus urumqiensis]PRO65320.1 cell division protein FtsL [Alkalicoccus urumqiensis]